MQNQNYRGVTPLKRKRNKITLNAAIILSVLVFIIGIICGSAASSGKQNREATKRIQQLEQDYEIEVTRLEKEIATIKGEYEKAQNDLAQAKSQISDLEKDIETQSAQTTEVPEEPIDDTQEIEEDTEPVENTGGILGKVIIGLLVLLIIICVIFAISIIIKRNNDDEYDDDEEYEEYDEDDEFEDDFDDDFDENEFNNTEE